MDLLRLLAVHDVELLYEPTGAEARHGMRVINPSPKTVLVELNATISPSAQLTVCVAAGRGGSSATLG